MKRVLFALLAALLLLGCTPEVAPEPTRQTEPVELPLPRVELTLWGPEAQLEWLQTLARDFSEAHAEEAQITVTVTAVEENQTAASLTRDLDSGADVFLFSGSQLESLASQGLLRRINEQMGLEALACPEAARWGDGSYAYPLGLQDGSILYYNKAFISDQEAASWESLLSAAAKQGKQVQLDLSNPWYTCGFFTPTAMELGYEKGASTLSWHMEEAQTICQAVAAIAADPALRNEPAGLLLENAASGELCAAVSGVWCAEDLKQLWGENFAVAALPRLPGGRAMGSFAVYQLVGVNAHTPQLYWAAELARYLTGASAQAGLADLGIVSPTAGEPSDPVLQALLTQNSSATVVPLGANFWTPMSRLCRSLTEAGETDWAAALEECAKAMNGEG